MNGTSGGSTAGRAAVVESSKVSALTSAFVESGPAIVVGPSVGVSDPVEPKPESTSMGSDLFVGVVRKLMLILEDFVFEVETSNLDIRLDTWAGGCILTSL